MEGSHVKGDVCESRGEQWAGAQEGGRGLGEVGERQEQFVWVILYLKKVTIGKYRFLALMMYCTKQNSKFRIKISFVQILTTE